MKGKGNRLSAIARVALLFLIFCAACTALSPPAPVETWKFAVLCDTRGDDGGGPGKTCLNDEVVGAIARDIRREGCELVIMPGDLVNGFWANGGDRPPGIGRGSTPYKRQFANWKKAMAPCYEAGIRVYAIRGNHEYGWAAESPFKPPYDLVAAPGLEEAFIEAFGDDNPDNGPPGEKELTYCVDNRNARFLGLDEYAAPHRVNQDWLEENLSGCRLPHIFVFGHEPAFRAKHPDCLASYPEARDLFWSSLGRAGARVYFCGHDHFYARSLIGDEAGREIFQIINGAGGAPLRKWDGNYRDPRVKPGFFATGVYGYNLVLVRGHEVTIQFKRWDGNNAWTVIDSFSYDVFSPSRPGPGWS
ncbi:MAG: metallophosphoesterase [Deltaproteobacteria bacterium]|nr:metallophosphoesterase [Deltaproteobacteria bacterium]